MENSSKRYCARGKECSQYRFLSEPARLRSMSKSGLCEGCQQEMVRKSQNEVPEVEPRRKGIKEFESSALRRIQQFKRDLVLQLYLEKGPFWEVIDEAREYWDPPVYIEVPPKNYSAVRAGGGLEWLQYVYDLIPDIIPERYYSYYSEHWWEQFVSACIHFHPPETELLAFAAFSDPEPLLVFPSGVLPEWDIHNPPPHIDVDNLPGMVAPPIKMMSDSSLNTAVNEVFWHHVVEALWSRHLKPLGFSDAEVASMIDDVINNVPEVVQQVLEELERLNRPRPYIEVDEHTTLDDVKNVYLAIRETQPGPEGRRSKRDPLTAVQCTILHDRHRWTYEQIAERQGFSDFSVASKYIQRGREILAEVGQ